MEGIVIRSQLSKIALRCGAFFILCRFNITAIIGKLPCGFKLAVKVFLLGKTPIAGIAAAIYLYCMKTTILLLSLVTLLSCSKSKDDVQPVRETVTFKAGAVNEQSSGGQYFWKLILNADKPVTVQGQATVTWDEYSSSTLMNSYSKTFTFDKSPGHTAYYQTGVHTRHGYHAKNVKITSLTVSGTDYILAY